jgi:hypothetical protein
MEQRTASGRQGSTTMKNSWLRLLLGVAVGGAGGFAYYYIIGCYGGACPLTSNPWLSTAYGALIGWLAVPRPSLTQQQENTTEQV